MAASVFDLSRTSVFAQRRITEHRLNMIESRFGMYVWTAASVFDLCPTSVPAQYQDLNVEHGFMCFTWRTTKQEAAPCLATSIQDRMPRHIWEGSTNGGKATCACCESVPEPILERIARLPVQELSVGTDPASFVFARPKSHPTFRAHLFPACFSACEAPLKP